MGRRLLSLLIPITLLLLVGCNGSALAPTVGVATKASVSAKASCLKSTCIYVLNCVYCGNATQKGSILLYKSGANGKVTPVKKMVGKEVSQAIRIAVDSNHSVWTSVPGPRNGSDPARLDMFRPGKYGNVTPTNVISGNYTELSYPESVAVDPSGKSYAGNNYYGAGCNNRIENVTVYAAGASGNVAPIAKFGAFYGVRIAVDADGGVYVADACGDIYVFTPSSSGYVQSQLITGYNTQLQYECYSNAIAVDSSKNIYVACDPDSTILMFSAGSNGDVAPTLDIAGSSTGLSGPVGIAVDSAGNIYAANSENYPPTITVYSAGSTGNVSPIQTITSTKMTGPLAIAVR